MTVTNYSEIESHGVFNELDAHGVMLSLPRLKEERNSEYRQRLLDVFVHRSSSGYSGLIYGIARELGLPLREEFLITPKDPVSYPYATIAFKDTRCCIYENYNQDPVLEFNRWSLDGGAYTLKELKDKIDGTPYFSVQTLNGINLSQRAMTIFEQKSVQYGEDYLSEGGKLITLSNVGLLEGSEYLSSSLLNKKVTDANIPVEDFKKGEYRINYEEGSFETNTTPDSNARIKYSYRNDLFTALSSPVIISNLQEQAFKKNLFKQIEQLDKNGVPSGLYENGVPTAFGADIINELLSVHPSTYKA